jgi:hypothetical protein
MVYVKKCTYNPLKPVLTKNGRGTSQWAMKLQSLPPKFSKLYIHPTTNYTKAISNVPLYKMITQHIMVFHREHITHMLCVKEKFTNI